MLGWELYKKWFNAWEGATATYMEALLKSPLLLEPSGALLSGAMKAKAEVDKAVAEGWGRLGVATKRDQERSLHALNQIQSKLLDLEERLAQSGR